MNTQLTTVIANERHHDLIATADAHRRSRLARATKAGRRGRSARPGTSPRRVGAVLNHLATIPR